ncbi:histone cell cycle regulator-like protein [Lycorma delicatula]|uniref:histone cell cycle regulator-like protein n=1 Tax=Lycorma delicatula TaxID=130591 RepID=UPI003F50DBA8
MKVLKPQWVTHDEMPIFSIDIHPDGSRFATGGQGEDSGRVVVWNMAPVVSEEKEMDENCPKMLCQLDNHQACVNSVRWSYSGKYLASGGDDKLIMIWNIAKYPSGGNAVFGSKGKVNVETWRCVCTLRGHQGDVLDMAWSPHDAWLASCSVDNTIIVWDANKMPEVVAVLKGHTGLVKGVTWDPVGKYLSSQSDDKSLRIWRTADWQQEAVIKEPFQECSGTTLVLRLGWSPDGQYLVSAHAMNGSGPTARIIERDGWRHGMDFVGHRQAVTCVRFNTNILQNYYKSMKKPLQACCCAIGSRDRSISVWVTALKRPLFAMENLFTCPVLDLSWSSSGLQLMACSGDGTVAFFQFTEKELGTALSIEEKNKLYERLYGKSMVGGRDSSAIALENPELLGISEGEKIKVAQPPPPLQPPPTPVLHPSPTNKQIETRTSDGRRRITPIFIPPTPDNGEGPAPFGSDSMTFSSSSEAKSRIIVERREDVVVEPNVTPAKNSQSASHNTATAVNNAASLIPTVKPSSPGTSASKLTGDTTVNRKRPRFADNTSFVTTEPVTTQPPSLPSSSVPVVQPSRSPQPLPITTVSTSVKKPVPLPLLSLGAANNVPITGSRKVVSIDNDTLISPHGPLTKVRVLNGLVTVWEYLLGSAVCGCVGNTQVICVACMDSTLHILDTDNGCHYLPPLALPTPASRLAISSSSRLLCLTACGRLSVWDLDKHKVIIASESILSILGSKGDTYVRQCFLSEEGVPLLALSSGKAYMFSLDLRTWMKVGDIMDPVIKNSQESYQLASKHLQDNKNLPLNRLHSFIQSGPVSRSRSLVRNFEISPSCTLSFLDQQLSVCKALHSGVEYRFWLLTSVRFMLQQGYEDKLRMICQDLLGPSHSSAHISSNWQSDIMGLSKHELLRDVLKEIGTRVEAQRLYTEFKDQLDFLSSKSDL